MLSLDAIYLGNEVADRDGGASLFFLRRWDQLRQRFQLTPSVADVSLTGRTAAIVTTSAYTTKTAGQYRINWSLRKISTDGVSSDCQITIGWVDRGVSRTKTGTDLTVDAVTQLDSGAMLVYADALTDITYAVSYASNTPNRMAFAIDVCVEQVG